MFYNRRREEGFGISRNMNLDIENIASTRQHIWRSIYEFIHDNYFKAVKFFPREFLDQCKKIQMTLRTYQIKSKQL